VNIKMDAMVDAIQDIVSTEPETGAQPDAPQPGDAGNEAELAEEISSLWTEHTRLSADRKVTSKELRLIRSRLAQRLHQMKAVLARPGRGGEWRGWLRERKIPRSTADRLVSRYAETLGSGSEENVLGGAISDPATPIHEKLATSVWSSLRKTLATGESVVQFVGCFVTAAGIAHEWRGEGLMIFNPTPQTADGVTGTGTAVGAAGSVPQAPEGGDASQADPPVADTAPQPSGEVPAITEEPSAKTALRPLGVDVAAFFGDTGGGGVV
jgi:hypothetical protein